MPDNGWEDMKSNMRTEGSRNNGNRQTETYDHGNVMAGGHGSRDKESGPVRQAGGRKYNRAYQRIQDLCK